MMFALSSPRVSCSRLRALALSVFAGMAVAAALTPGVAPAQSPPAGQGSGTQGEPPVTTAESSRPFWECSLPGGMYTVALKNISVVSLHEFSTPGGRVTEMNIVTDGAALARFYHMEAAGPGGGTAAAETAKARLTDLANSAADRTGTDRTWEKVQKDYPLATHAHTIEFRLVSKADLLALHRSAREAWMDGRGRAVTLKR